MPNDSNCRSCGRQVVWIKTATEKKMPIDAETWEPGDETFDRTRHTSHFASCPQAKAWRKQA